MELLALISPICMTFALLLQKVEERNVEQMLSARWRDPMER